MSSERRREIDRRVNERYLTAPGDRSAYLHDPQHHASIQQVRALLGAAEEAMDREGIREETRDRVIFRLLYGEAPEGIAAPDWREAFSRAADRTEETIRLMSQPMQQHWELR